MEISEFFWKLVISMAAPEGERGPMDKTVGTDFGWSFPLSPHLLTVMKHTDMLWDTV